MQKPLKVVVTDFIQDDLCPERGELSGVADVAALGASSEELLQGRIEDADAIMLYHSLSITRRTLERLHRCKLIVRCGVGYDNVDHAFARSRGIDVANVPDYGTEEVADSAIGMALALTRGFTFLNSRLRQKQGAWSYTHAAPLRRLRGNVFGIVGLGRIGTAAALRAKALGMDVLFYDPFKANGCDKALGIRRARSVEELFRASYVLSLHCPLTPETRHLVNARTLAWLPQGAVLINTARGAIVDVAAIPDAIASGRLLGAGIDVLDGEPPAETNPLIAAWRNPEHPAHHRVLVNPHSAFYCEEGLNEMRVKGSRACRCALLGEPVPNVVN
ncbi:MAG: C-terminal binding protein [Planctomycetes bacterium]|nr:C-terminal binding protein [Planctomycetota bacterium]